MTRTLTFEPYAESVILDKDNDLPVSVAAFQIIYESLFLAQPRPKPGAPSVEPWTVEQRRRNAKIQRLLKGISVPYPERAPFIPPQAGPPRRLICAGASLSLEQVEVDHIIERIGLVDWLPMLDTMVVDTLDFLSPNK